MLRLLVIFIVLFIALTLTAKARKLISKSQDSKKSDGAMVKCVVCDVYLPSSEARTNAAGDFFCDQHIGGGSGHSESDN